MRFHVCVEISALTLSDRKHQGQVEQIIEHHADLLFMANLETLQQATRMHSECIYLSSKLLKSLTWQTDGGEGNRQKEIHKTMGEWQNDSITTTKQHRQARVQGGNIKLAQHPAKEFYQLKHSTLIKAPPLKISNPRKWYKTKMSR